MIEFLSSENLLKFFDFNEQGYVYFILAFLIYLAVFLLLVWISIGIYVFVDLRRRGVRFFWALIGGLLAFLFNFPALVVYVILRPDKTKDEAEWEELERLFISQDVEGHKVCMGCGEVVKPEHLFCPGCGLQYRSHCECGEIIDNEWRFCPYCKRENLSYQNIATAIEGQQLKTKETKKEVTKTPSPKPTRQISFKSYTTKAVGVFVGMKNAVKNMIKKISIPKRNFSGINKTYKNVANKFTTTDTKKQKIENQTQKKHNKQKKKSSKKSKRKGKKKK